MNKNHKGFGLIELLLAFVVVGIFCLAGWFVYHSKQNTKNNQSKSMITNSQNQACLNNVSLKDRLQACFAEIPLSSGYKITSSQWKDNMWRYTVSTPENDNQNSDNGFEAALIKAGYTQLPAGDAIPWSRWKNTKLNVVVFYSIAGSLDIEVMDIRTAVI